MPDPSPTRLASSHLEDLAIVALTARAGQTQLELYPTLDDKRRATLRSRIKLIGRHDWPSNLQEDPLLRRGYTLDQCFRLLVALLIIDGQTPPSLAVAIAAANEVAFLRAIASSLETDDGGSIDLANDLICVILIGELWEHVDPTGWKTAQTQRVRLIKRSDVHRCWSEDASLAYAGQRLFIDIAAAARAVWQWLSGRRLMLNEDRLRLLSAVAENKKAAGFVPVSQRIWRR